MLGSSARVFILLCGMIYLNWRMRQAAAAGEGYGSGHINEPDPVPEESLVNPVVAILPLIVVGVANKVFTLDSRASTAAHYQTPWSAGLDQPIVIAGPADPRSGRSKWRLLLGILLTLLLSFAWSRASAFPRARESPSPARCWPRSTPPRNTASAR